MRVALAAVLLAVLVAPVRADDESARARSLFDEGTALFKAGDFVSALDRFRAAYAVEPRASILNNIGATLLRLGRKADAANAFTDYLGHPDADARQRDRVERELEQIAPDLSRLDIDIRREGDATLDGGPIGHAPLIRVWWVDPGAHELAVSVSGGRPVVRRFDAAAGNAVSVVIPAARRAPSVELARRPRAPRRPPTHAHTDVRRRWRALLHVHGVAAAADGDGLRWRGATTAAGAAARIVGPIDLFTAGLFGDSLGAEIGARVVLGQARLRVFASLSAQLFSRDGLEPGARLGAGAALDVTPRIQLVVGFGAALAPAVPTPVEDRYLLGTLGFEVGL